MRNRILEFVMPSQRIPVAGYPHLSIAAQNDDAMATRLLGHLRKAGFVVEPSLATPPDGMTSKAVIRAITEAFYFANSR